MNKNHVKLLTMVSATDESYKGHLQTATVKEIKEALSIMDTNGMRVWGNATRITLLKRELRKRNRQKSKK